MVDGMELAAPIGKSHHVVISYRFYCYMEEAKAQQPRYIYHKGDYEGMRRAASEINWDAPPQSDVDTTWRALTNNVKTLIDKYIPKTKPAQSMKPRPHT